MSRASKYDASRQNVINQCINQKYSATNLEWRAKAGWPR